MASVPNRVYPLREFNEIGTLKVGTTDLTASGLISGSRLIWSSVRVTGYTSSMTPGEIIIMTGASGTTAALYVKLKSGSTTAIWAGANLTYTSVGE